MNPSEAQASDRTTGLEHETTEGFREQFRDLHESVRRLARNRFNNFCRTDPKHPALRGHFVPDVYQSARVWMIDAGGGYRALAFVVPREGGALYQWYWIGNAEDYLGRSGG